MLGNFDAPRRRNAPALLPPFGARRMADTKGFGMMVHIVPGQICHALAMGQFVPFVKDNVSRVFENRLGQNMLMAESDTKSDFKAAMIERTARLRKGRGWTQEMMADALGISMETYKKYETRSLLPHDLISKFALLVDRDTDYVLTGKTTVRRISAAAIKKTATG